MFFFFVVNAACSSDAHAERKDARPNWLSAFYLWGIGVFYVEVKNETYLCVKTQRSEMN